MVSILGVSALYHDSAACLVVDGEIIAAAQEERFTRKKHDPRFPSNSIHYCLSEAGIRVDQLDFVAFYEKPLLKFDRLLETYLTYAPAGLPSFLRAMPVWLKEKLWLPDLIRAEMAKLTRIEEKPAKKPGKEFKWKLLFGDHHESHAASAFYPSPFEEAVIVTADGVGEWATTSIATGRGNEITFLKKLHFPHSIGLLYSAFTYYAGFKVNSGEYKVMGLAPYGEPTYVPLIKEKLLEIRDDGSIRMNDNYFGYSRGLRMTNEAFARLFGGPPRQPESKITQKEMDLARSIQVIVEEVMLKIANYAHKLTGMKRLCLAGGVALNCVANGRILREGPFEDIWIQPAAGDAGGALGVAMAVWHRYLNNPRTSSEKIGAWRSSNHRDQEREPGVLPAMPGVNGGLAPYADGMKGSFLGPGNSDQDIELFLQTRNLPYIKYSREEIAEVVADLLATEKIVGLHQGRMEFGPRALGARSIIGNASSPGMQAVMNLKIKYRESFRPFAPSVQREHVADWFELDNDSPYMLLVADVTSRRQRKMTERDERLWGIERLNIARSDIPAVTHVDYSARIHTVRRETNPLYWEIIDAFRRKTGCPVIVNTSFNVRGEPMVCTPEDSYRCFMRTEMDALVLETFVLRKEEQPRFKDKTDWRSEYALD